ncbi:MAG TPA: hypothetical protein VMA98_10365 [Candidatus Acidoferrales bacterium]|nr:hypothetical protein [Candidatus Acidoferrales bacterium]
MSAAKLELPLYRLYVLRVSYALIGVWQGLRTWPAILHHAHPWDFWHGVGMSFLGALTLLALLGIRYPVRMMPLLFFELAWKLVWVLAAYLPPYLARGVDPALADNFIGIFLGVVVVPLVLPWGYVWRNYVLAPGDRWR